MGERIVRKNKTSWIALVKFVEEPQSDHWHGTVCYDVTKFIPFPTLRRRLAEPTADIPVDLLAFGPQENTSLLTTEAMSLGALALGYLSYRAWALWKSFETVDSELDLEAPHEMELDG